MQLSKDFTLEELTVTDQNIKNTPDEVETKCLLMLATYVLQPIRDKWGAIHINSGYRSQALQEKLKELGYPTSNVVSQHELGEAADIKPLEANIQQVFEWIKNNLQYGQVILEYHNGSVWIHVSLPRLYKRNQWAMIYDGKYTDVA